MTTAPAACDDNGWLNNNGDGAVLSIDNDSTNEHGQGMSFPLFSYLFFYLSFFF
jgi:hypothetical protein